MRKIELLSPAGDLASGIAAIDYGADAVYIGGANFGARRAAANSTEDIAQLVEYARPFGVRVYAALNTLVYENELKQAEQIARELIEAGVDALIVQDMAFLRMGLEGMEIHASTQTCNTTPERVKFLQECGFSRVILERALTIKEIRNIRTRSKVELECFVHGAICVGFSGQCYLSRSMSERSGNRGECTQACRLSYDLVRENGEALIAGKHLLSVQDMNLSARIPQLIEAGVDSFKIEGRLKDIEYVKNITAHYRGEIDRAISRFAAGGEEICRSSSGRTELDFQPDPLKTFTRDGGLWMIDGKRDGVATFNTPKSTGTFLGEVGHVNEDNFELRGPEVLNPGDGVCFIVNGELSGTNINRVEARTVYPNKMDNIVPGMKMYRNYDHQFTMTLQHSRTRRVIDVRAEVEASESILTLRLTDSDGVRVEVSREGALEVAKNVDKMVDTIRTQIAKSGETIFSVSEVDITTGSGGFMPFVPVSALNELRREGLDTLLAQRTKLAIESGINRKLPVENKSYPYPTTHIGGDGNVTNSLAELFYRDHGVESMEAGFDLRNSMGGERVMVSAYCIRREIGECPKVNKRSIPIGETLLLKRGRQSYKLEFDCQNCLMSVISVLPSARVPTGTSN